MTCALMGLQPVSLESQNAMSAVDGATIERRIRISRPDEGRGRCKGSRAWDPRKDFSQCMQQPIILSTSSAISPQQERTEPSVHRPCRRGVKSSLRREPDVPGDLLHAIFGNVTEPALAYRLRKNPQPVDCGSSWDCKTFMNAVDGATIERRIRISQLEEGSARCNVSRAWDPRKDFSQPTQPPTCSSKGICRPARLGNSGHRPNPRSLPHSPARARVRGSVEP